MRRILAVFLFFLGLSSSWNVLAEEEKAYITFAATSTAFVDQGALPLLYTCDGKDISPQLSWSNPPKKTKSFAIIFSDPDAPQGIFYHWVVYNLPKTTNELIQNVKTLPKGSEVGYNSFDKQGYSGPCPPKGTTHTYLIMLYALDTSLSLTGKVDGPALVEAIKEHSLGYVALSAVYGRQVK